MTTNWNTFPTSWKPSVEVRSSSSLQFVLLGNVPAVVSKDYKIRSDGTTEAVLTTLSQGQNIQSSILNTSCLFVQVQNDFAFCFELEGYPNFITPVKFTLQIHNLISNESHAMLLIKNENKTFFPTSLGRKMENKSFYAAFLSKQTEITVSRYDFDTNLVAEVIITTNSVDMDALYPLTAKDLTSMSGSQKRKTRTLYYLGRCCKWHSSVPRWKNQLRFIVIFLSKILKEVKNAKNVFSWSTWDGSYGYIAECSNHTFIFRNYTAHEYHESSHYLQEGQHILKVFESRRRIVLVFIEEHKEIFCYSYLIYTSSQSLQRHPTRFFVTTTRNKLQLLSSGSRLYGMIFRTKCATK